MEKLCDCIRIQKLVLLFTWATWLLWLAATCLYIPYILYLAPSVPKNPADPDSERIPGPDYGSGKMAAIIVTTGLIIDSFMLAGIHVPYKVKTDLLYPWFCFYSVFIVGLVALSAFLGFQLEGRMKLVALGPAVAALLYMFMFWCVVQLFRFEINKKSVFMEGFNQIVMEPLADKARKGVAEEMERRQLKGEKNV